MEHLAFKVVLLGIQHMGILRRFDLKIFFFSKVPADACLVIDRLVRPLRASSWRQL
jgi:hypothetical protein